MDSMIDTQFQTDWNRLIFPTIFKWFELIYLMNLFIGYVCIVSIPGLIPLIHGFKSMETQLQTDWNRLIFPTIFKWFELIYLMNLFIGYINIKSLPGLIPLIHGINNGLQITPPTKIHSYSQPFSNGLNLPI